MSFFSGRRTPDLDAVTSRRLVTALLCSTLLWWVPGSPALGPVAVGAAEPTEGRDASPTSSTPATIATVALASSETDDPLVVRRTVTATVGRSHVASPHHTNGPTTVGDVVLTAYQVAASVAPKSCNLDVSLLAAIGQVESGNLAGRRLDSDHRPVPPVLGPVLNGAGGFSAIADTDGGAWDGDKSWDRAVGPMQFIPSTWRLAGVDLDGDGERNPQDIEDAAGAAMVYLCAGGVDLSSDEGLRAAIYAYNHSHDYVALVLAWKDTFDTQGLDLTQAEAPLLDLDTAAYQQVVKKVDKSSARTAHALKSSGTVKLAKDAAEEQIEAEEEAAEEQADDRGTSDGKKGSGTKATAAPSASASPSAGSGPASGPTSGPASASAGSSPAASTTPGSGSSATPSPASESSAPAPSKNADPAPSQNPPASQDPTPKQDPPASQDPTPNPDPPASQDPAPNPDPTPADCPTGAEATPVDPSAPVDPTAPAADPSCPAPSETPSDAPAATASSAAATEPTP